MWFCVLIFQHWEPSHSYLLSRSLTPLKRPTCDLRQNPWQKAWSKINCPTCSTVPLSPRETLLRVYLQRDTAVQWKKNKCAMPKGFLLWWPPHAWYPLTVPLCEGTYASPQPALSGWEVKAEGLGSLHINRNIHSEVFSHSPTCSSAFFLVEQRGLTRKFALTFSTLIPPPR